MKRFIAKTIFFTFPIIAAALLMEILLRNIPNDYSFKRNFFDINSGEIETLILGSSHSFYGFNPVFFDTKTFNASHISQSLNYDYEIVKKYQYDLEHLTTIVLPISYFTLFSELGAGIESWRVKNYLIYYNMYTSKSLKDYSEILSNHTYVNIKRLLSYYLLNKSQISCTDLGWGTNYKSENSRDLVETGITASKRHTRDEINSDKFRSLFQDNVRILNSILEWCDNRNIKILLITPPAYETYRQNLNMEQLNATIKTTNQICSKYKNCKYLNLLYSNNFIDTDYFDADHLSEIGAEKLSKLINNKIKEWK